MKPDIQSYNNDQTSTDRAICDRLASELTQFLGGAESKIWHRHPVWFVKNNPIVGYSKLKGGVRLMFWSGASFDEPKLEPGTGKFKDASIRYHRVEDIDSTDLKRWCALAGHYQWDYANIVKRKGKLVKLGDW
jgi:hypothetical protein